MTAFRLVRTLTGRALAVRAQARADARPRARGHALAAQARRRNTPPGGHRRAKAGLLAHGSAPPSRPSRCGAPVTIPDGARRSQLRGQLRPRPDGLTEFPLSPRPVSGGTLTAAPSLRCGAASTRQPMKCNNITQLVACRAHSALAALWNAGAAAASPSAPRPLQLRSALKIVIERFLTDMAAI